MSAESEKEFLSSYVVQDDATAIDKAVSAGMGSTSVTNASSVSEASEKPDRFFEKLATYSIESQATILQQTLSKEEIITLCKEEPVSSQMNSDIKKLTPFFKFLKTIPQQDAEELLQKYGEWINVTSFDALLEKLAKWDKRRPAYIWALGFAQIYRMLNEHPAPKKFADYFPPDYAEAFVREQPVAHLRNIIVNNLWSLIFDLIIEEVPDKISPIINPWFSEVLEKLAEALASEGDFPSDEKLYKELKLLLVHAPIYLSSFLLAYENAWAKRMQGALPKQFIPFLVKLREDYRKAGYIVGLKSFIQRNWESLPASEGVMMYRQLGYIIEPQSVLIDRQKGLKGAGVVKEQDSLATVLTKVLNQYLEDEKKFFSFFQHSALGTNTVKEILAFVGSHPALNAYAYLAMITFYKLEVAKIEMVKVDMTKSDSAVLNLLTSLECCMIEAIRSRTLCLSLQQQAIPFSSSSSDVGVSQNGGSEPANSAESTAVHSATERQPEAGSTSRSFASAPLRRTSKPSIFSPAWWSSFSPVCWPKPDEPEPRSVSRSTAPPSRPK